MREPSHRLTQHKRRGGRSLLTLWGPEEAPTLYFKGSKPGAATAGWSLFSWERFDISRATRASGWSTVEPPWWTKAHSNRPVLLSVVDRPQTEHSCCEAGELRRSLDCRGGAEAARSRCAKPTAWAGRQRGSNKGSSPARAVAPHAPRRLRGWLSPHEQRGTLDGGSSCLWTGGRAQSPLRGQALGATTRVWRGNRGDENYGLASASDGLDPPIITSRRRADGG